MGKSEVWAPPVNKAHGKWMFYGMNYHTFNHILQNIDFLYDIITYTYYVILYNFYVPVQMVFPMMEWLLKLLYQYMSL